MPIYEYKCETCETRFEKLIRTAAEPAELECPACGQYHLSRQQSTFAARANGASPEQQAPSCGGVCRTPGLCGMN